ncbi:MAG: hypothetical protein EZS28_034492 [Streblomastix strix]|uniref:Uncharacterized protein n=1 Tax=Streblomastix strix TaxID=222440 RepID=A0A5J4UIV9_9EUKA|nr:MAG: hypothetical protein EZS28_034492 [Streblomastix strix]
MKKTQLKRWKGRSSIQTPEPLHTIGSDIGQGMSLGQALRHMNIKEQNALLRMASPLRYFNFAYYCLRKDYT